MASVLVVLNWELKMGFPSFLLSFFLVFHLFLSSGSSCPPSFNCGRLGSIKYPFTTINAYPECGLYALDCSKTVPEVELGEKGKSIQVSSIDGYAINISDPTLKSLIEKKSCDIFSYFHPPNNDHIPYTISPSRTSFKCDRPDHDDQIDKYISDDYIRYRGAGCDGSAVFYLYPNNTVPTPGSYPPNCEFFQLPVAPSTDGRNLSDPFLLLTSEFSVEYHVSEACKECHANGGWCLGDSREFQCVDEKGGTDKRGGTDEKGGTDKTGGTCTTINI